MYICIEIWYCMLMKFSKKAGVALAVSIPSVFLFGTNAGAEKNSESPEATTTTATSEVYVHESPFESPGYYAKTTNNLDSSDNEGDLLNIAVMGLGAVLLVGSGVLIVKDVIKSDTDDGYINDGVQNSQENIFPDAVSASNQSMPIGPEDDPNFWPPKS